MEINEHLERILASGMLTLGEYDSDSERQFANFVGIPHAVAVNSGTNALRIPLRACRLKQGVEVIVPTNTFAATDSAVVFASGRPVITDVCPKLTAHKLEYCAERHQN